MLCIHLPNLGLTTVGGDLYKFCPLISEDFLIDYINNHDSLIKKERLYYTEGEK